MAAGATSAYRRNVLQSQNVQQVALAILNRVPAAQVHQARTLAAPTATWINAVVLAWAAWAAWVSWAVWAAEEWACSRKATAKMRWTVKSME